MNTQIAQPATDNDAGISIIKSGSTLFFCSRTMKILIRHPSDATVLDFFLVAGCQRQPGRATRAVNDTARTTPYDVAQRTVQCDSSHSYSRFIETKRVYSWGIH